MPAYDGKHLIIDLMVTIWSIVVKIEGIIEVFDIRRRFEDG
jgi:hypothetical protein